MWLRTIRLAFLLTWRWKWGPLYSWQYAMGWRERCDGTWLAHEVEGRGSDDNYNSD